MASSGAAAYRSSKTESMNTAYWSGDSGQPCTTPLWTEITVEHTPSTRTLLLAAVYIQSISRSVFPDTPFCSSRHRTRLRGTEPYAFPASKRHVSATGGHRAVRYCVTATPLWSTFSTPQRRRMAYCRLCIGVPSTGRAVSRAKNSLSTQEIIVSSRLQIAA